MSEDEKKMDAALSDEALEQAAGGAGGTKQVWYCPKCLKTLQYDEVESVFVDQGTTGYKCRTCSARVEVRLGRVYE